jgi:hypothetical protein
MSVHALYFDVKLPPKPAILAPSEAISYTFIGAPLMDEYALIVV